MTIDDLLARLDNVQSTRRGRAARCPAHEDRRASLSIGLGADGRVLLHCFAGCRPEEIVAKLGLHLRDLFPESAARRARPPAPRPEWMTPLMEARREILTTARRQPWARPGVLAAYEEADRVRATLRQIDAARNVATARGPSEIAWELLALAVSVERDVLMFECAA